ncbi:LysR family transcriptional regulator [Sphingobium sp. DEHP117]|uniref:LysR family transcriptional regulator n=1 Tax=Sphingobium sp. DEHP117 TaxID=2993436 RepID=UPI0027D51C7C|nr:LysR family transcriptional regulator [Sphingobium sp. DEHP117]MDQ4420131.1 LysR family transcriptional regulator [Sphingobium sp. DEHP117]
MIDRYLVRYFLSVVDHGNFSAGARHCRVSQPTLSVGIVKLEEALDRKLFERTNRRVELTPAGVRFLPHARRIEADFTEAEYAARADKPTATIRIGIMTALPASWVQSLVSAACGSTEERIEIVDARARDLPALLDRGRIDAAIGLRVPGSSEGTKIFEEGYALAFPIGHRLASEKVVSADAVAGETMFVRRNCEALAEVSQYFTSRGIRPFMAARTSDEERAIAYVRSGLGITVMPSSFAQAGMAMVSMAGFTKTRTICFFQSKERNDLIEKSSAISRLVTALRELSEQ